MSLLQRLPWQLVVRIDAAAQLGKNLMNGEPLPEIPPVDLRVMLSGSYFKDKLKLSLHGRYVLKQTRISPEFGKSATPAFWLMDLDVSYDAIRWLTLSGGVRNLFDMAYYEHLNRSVSGTGHPIYNPGRNIYLGLMARF